MLMSRFFSKRVLHLGAIVIGVSLVACTSNPTPTTLPPLATRAPSATIVASTPVGGATDVVTPIATTTPLPPSPTPANLLRTVADCAYGGALKSIEAVDALTVKIALCAPDVALPAKLAFPAFGIHPAADLGKITDAPNGTGPYRFQQWIASDRLIFDANATYWGGTPATLNVVIRWAKHANQRLVELQLGTATGIEFPAPEEFGNISNDPNLKLVMRPSPLLTYLGFNRVQPPFDKPEARQAIASALDRPALVASAFPSGTLVAEQVASPALLPGYTSALTAAPFNLEQAKAAIAAHFPPNTEITLTYRREPQAYLPAPDRVAQAIADQLHHAGLSVTLNPLDGQEFWQAVTTGQAAFYLLGWGLDYADASNVYEGLFIHNNTWLGGGDSEIVDAVQAAARTVDVAERQAHYDRANAAIQRAVPLIPLAHIASGLAFAADVTPGAIHAFGENWATLAAPSGTLTFMQVDEPRDWDCANPANTSEDRVCALVYEPLVSYQPNTLTLAPALAERWSANADLTEWTFYLRPNVIFHSGAVLEANDVVATLSAQWDAKHPAHTGPYTLFQQMFGTFINQ